MSIFKNKDDIQNCANYRLIKRTNIQGVMKRYRNDQKDLYLVFITLEKAYDRVSREILWEALEKKDVERPIFKLSRICMMGP